jgi:hypothetical protein
MSITYGYFNSVNGDRKYNADQMSQYFKGLISNGVFANIGGSMAVVADGQSMSVNVLTGRAVIDCKWIENDAAFPLTISQSHATLPRYTAVVVQLDSVERLIRITTKDGTPASTPEEPEIDSATELCLAMILVPAQSNTVIQSRVIDKRGSSLCLWVTGLITQLDTSELFLQWESAFNNYFEEMTAAFSDWFSGLTEDLNVNTYVRRYQKRVVLSNSNVVSLDMTGYTYEATDIINVYVNGLFGVAGVDFTLDTSGTTPTVTTQAEAAGTVVTIDVMKSVIGFPALGTESLNTLTTENDVPIEA